MATELVGTGHKDVQVIGLVDLHTVWVRLACPSGQLRLGVEEVYLTGTAVLDQLDNRFGPALKCPGRGLRSV